MDAMIIHIVRRDRALGPNPIVLHSENVAYAIVVAGKLEQVIQ